MNNKLFFKNVLQAAALYNILWGIWVGLFPFALFDFAGIMRPNYPEIWQCVGMIVGVYGVGYWIASYNPQRHWPIVLVGFLGKIFGPIGFLYALSHGVYNLKFGLTILTNDLIWWIPFFLILKSTFNIMLNPSLVELKNFDQLKTHSPFSILFTGRWLILCVRHSGCTFCREELSNFQSYEKKFHSLGVRTAVVHMGPEDSGKELQKKYNLLATNFISDTEQQLYRLFALKRGTYGEVLGLKSWLRGFKAGILKGHGIGALDGDGLQLGGAIYMKDGDFQILHRSTYAGDIGDFDKLHMEIFNRSNENNSGPSKTS